MIEFHQSNQSNQSHQYHQSHQSHQSYQSHQPEQHDQFHQPDQSTQIRFYPYEIYIDNLDKKFIESIQKEADEKKKQIYNFIQYCYDFLKYVEEKMQGEKNLIEQFSKMKIEEEKNIITQIASKNKGKIGLFLLL